MKMYGNEINLIIFFSAIELKAEDFKYPYHSNIISFSKNFKFSFDDYYQLLEICEFLEEKLQEEVKKRWEYFPLNKIPFISNIFALPAPFALHFIFPQILSPLNFYPVPLTTLPFPQTLYASQTKKQYKLW